MGEPPPRARRDHRALIASRVTLDLARRRQPRHGDRPIERIAKPGASDPQLVALLFQYGRYLLIASSRPGTQPANLQGIWNDEVRPPWSSNYTININTEMNYWPAESANLADCTSRCSTSSASWRSTARRPRATNYGARGWTSHHNTDLWRQSAPVGDFGEGDPVWAIWPMGGAVALAALWEHYAFGGDATYLRDARLPA